MKPILKFPKVIIISLLSLLSWSGCAGQEESVVVQVPYSPDYEPPTNQHHLDYVYEEEEQMWPGNHRGSRAMYLAQGVEFVFPIGVQYTLANVNEQLWPIRTTGFDSVLEFPANKIALMFSSMLNTLKIANFTVMSHIYTPEQEKKVSTPLRILGTELRPADFRNGYKDTWSKMNADVSEATGGSIPEFVPRGGLYGRTIYPFTKAAFLNSIHYENQWAFPWKDAPLDKFTDSANVPYMEVEGLMPYYENHAFVAIAALFKSGTGSVVFLKPKGAMSILQLMLNPTALTQIFDENFPGWGVKQMRVKVPQASFTTNTQHLDMLVKRGVANSFCVHDREQAGGDKRFSLNPIVQTNHLRLAKDKMTMASVTGVTLNSEEDLKQWENRQRDDVAPETLLEEYTTPQAPSSDVEEASTQSDAVVEDEEAAGSTTNEPGEEAVSGRSDLASLSLANANTSTTVPPPVLEEKVAKVGVDDGELYDFNEPFLWFLHAINEEPMFMGVVESFKRYAEETGHKDNVKGETSPMDKNGWIYEAAKGVLWHCPSTLNKQAE